MFLSYSAYGCLQSKIHQNSWKWLAISPITTFAVWMLWTVAGVDGFISYLRAVNICPGRWIIDLHLILGCLVGLWINANTFRSICLNRDPILNSDHYECGTMPLDRSRGRVLRGARPTGLGEAARPGFLPISVHFWCTCSWNKKASKTCGTH